jgi:chromosome segregation ATPase
MRMSFPPPASGVPSGPAGGESALAPPRSAVSSVAFQERLRAMERAFDGGSASSAEEAQTAADGTPSQPTTTVSLAELLETERRECKLLRRQLAAAQAAAASSDSQLVGTTSELAQARSAAQAAEAREEASAADAASLRTKLAALEKDSGTATAAVKAARDGASQAAQAISLLNTESVLLVDHDHSEPIELDGILQQRVGSDHDASRSGRDLIPNLALLRR